VRARIVDPVGPRWWRALPYLTSSFFLLAACFAPSGATALLGIGFTAFFLAPWLSGRRAARDVELLLGPGHIDVRGAGLLSQRIEARSIEGASTARLQRGVGLAIARSGRDRAVSFVLENDADAHAVRDALGIGHHGFGELPWVLGPSGTEKIDALARLFAWPSACASVAAFAFRLTWLFPLLLPAAAATLIVLLSFVIRSVKPHLFLRADGVHGYFPGWQHFGYASIADARVEGDALKLVFHGRAEPVWVRLGRTAFTTRGVSADELAQLTGQLLSAAQRAQGGAPEKELPATRIDLLARGRDSREAWLARLDATAATFAASGGYRGAELVEEDLWATLKDPEAPAELRAGAARVLVRVAPERGRAEVASVLAAVRVPEDEDTIRSALPEPEHEKRA
jgi:hypothetical protein